MDDAAARQSSRWRLLYWVAGASMIVAPAYLWQTNYCFAELRYVPKSEICEKYLASFPDGTLMPNSRCAFQTSSWVAFDVIPTAVNPKLYPQTQSYDLTRYYDSCGRRLKFH